MFMTIDTDRLLKGSLRDGNHRRREIERLLHELFKYDLELNGQSGAVAPAETKLLPPPKAHQLLTSEQVMELVPVSRATLHRMVQDNRFQAPKRKGGRRMWRARDVYAYIEKDDDAKQGATKAKKAVYLSVGRDEGDGGKRRRTKAKHTAAKKTPKKTLKKKAA